MIGVIGTNALIWPTQVALCTYNICWKHLWITSVWHVHIYIYIFLWRSTHVFLKLKLHKWNHTTKTYNSRKIQLDWSKLDLLLATLSGVAGVIIGLSWTTVACSTYILLHASYLIELIAMRLNLLKWDERNNLFHTFSTWKIDINLSYLFWLILVIRTSKWDTFQILSLELVCARWYTRTW